MFANFFLDPTNTTPEPKLDSLGVQIKPSDPNQATTKVTAHDAIKWIGKDQVKAKFVCLIMIRCLFVRADLPSLHVAQVFEDVLPHIIQEILLPLGHVEDHEYYRTRLAVQLVDHVESLFNENSIGSLEELVATVEGDGKIPDVGIDLEDLSWLTLLSAALFLEPANAYVVYVSVTCRHDPLAYLYIAGVVLARISEKRAHYITALAASTATAIKNGAETKYAVPAVLDFLAGLGLKKWEHCKDDTHKIFPITLSTLCCAAISRIARPKSVSTDESLDILLEYSFRFLGQSCFWDWIAKMPLTSPCDRGVGDMDITPLMQAIVFTCAFERRLACDLTCFDRAKALRESVCKRANSPHTRALLDVDLHHKQYMGGLCNTMASVYRSSFYFSQLMRVSLVFGRQATAPITEATYIGEHWNASLACLRVFDRATSLYLPDMMDSENWSNVNKLTFPIGQCLAGVIYSLSEYCQKPRKEDDLRSRSLTSLTEIFEKYDSPNFRELLDSIIKELLDHYPIGPVFISACVYVIDSYRRIWFKSHRDSAISWWRPLKPIFQLVESDDIKLFWCSVIQSAAILVQTAAQTRSLSENHSSHYNEAKNALEGLANRLRIELKGAADRENDFQMLTTTIWQIEQISDFELTNSATG